MSHPVDFFEFFYDYTGPKGWAEALSAEEESAVCCGQETSRFLVALLLGMTRALLRLEKNKAGAACFEEVKVPTPSNSLRAGSVANTRQGWGTLLPGATNAIIVTFVGVGYSGWLGV